MSPSAEDTVTDAAEFWETRYLTHRDENGRMWSGRVNATVEQELTEVAPGSALELGSGEGADALWLARRGWRVTAVDISEAALAVGRAEAERMGLADRIDWVHADLAAWQPSAEYDLVTSAFFHSPVDFPREAILRRAAAAVAPGGGMLVVGHGPFPPGSGHEHDRDRGALPLPGPDEVLAALDLPPGWTVETNAFVARVTTRDGAELALTDSVLRVRRDR